MKNISDLKIGTRLAAGFAAVTALLMAVAGIGFYSIDVVDDHAEVILHDRYVKVAQAHTIENEVNRQSRALRTSLIASDPAVARAELAKLEQSAPVVAKAFERLAATIHTDKGKAALQAMEQARAAFKVREQEVVEMVRGGRIEEGRNHLVGVVLPVQNAYLKAIEDFAQTQVDGMEQFGEEAARTAQRAGMLLVSLAVLAVALAAGIGFWLTRSITVPISRAVQVARTVAAGDLSSVIEVHSRDETGQLMAALRTMNDSLAGIVQQVRQSSDSIATGSTQIANGNADLSQRTDEQASNLQQTAASMEEITATVRQSAEAARAASELANTASAAAAKGGGVVAEVSDTMKDISAKSRRIEDITGVIDGIAFQTNILALNAAVEAARAGEQGRGFAVVAGEVRSLAQRAASAAKEIKQLIGESVGSVETGARRVVAAESAMGEIVGHVQRVAALVGEIGSAAREQTTGIGQISDAVSQLDQVTQQNAALVEESAAAAESLSHQASRLAEMVRAFRLVREPVAA